MNQSPDRRRLLLLLPLLLLLQTARLHAAEEGVLALTTEPREAQIRVDGQLKATRTPVILHLPPGKHHIQAQSGDKHAELQVFIGADAVVSRKLTLAGAAPVVPASQIPDLLFPMRDAFETPEEFAARRARLIQRFNTGSRAHEPAYQAGTATLLKDQYDIDSGSFPVKIQWRSWVKPWVKQLRLKDTGYIQAPREQARRLWREGPEKAVFLTARAGKEGTERAGLELTGLGRGWALRISFVSEAVRIPGGILEVVKLPGGSFRMGDLQGGGDSDEEPVHRVHIKPFAIGKYEVTFAQYDAFAEATGRKKPDDEGWGRGNRPVINVTWNDAVAYAQWLSQQTGEHYRLPTEAEWEYAARAGTEMKYWWGNDIGKNRANCDGCGSLWDNQKTAPAGSFKPNPFGLYDTAGNVWEWVQDCYHDNYQGAPSDGSAWLGGDCGRRVLRGGSWFNGPGNLRAAARNLWWPDGRNSIIGFRLARML